MGFQHYDLGHLTRGQTVQVSLGYAANVRLLDDREFQKYRRGTKHRYYGGYYKRSPVRLDVPCTDRWHVVVDLGGYAGRVKSNVSVFGGQSFAA